MKGIYRLKEHRVFNLYFLTLYERTVVEWRSGGVNEIERKS